MSLINFILAEFLFFETVISTIITIPIRKNKKITKIKCLTKAKTITNKCLPIMIKKPITNIRITSHDSIGLFFWYFEKSGSSTYNLKKNHNHKFLFYFFNKAVFKSYIN